MANALSEINFFKYWKFFFALSLLVTLTAVVTLIVRAATSSDGSPFNLGVDFTGGNTYVLQGTARVTTGEIRARLDFLNKEPIVQVSPDEKPTIVIRTPPLTPEERQKMEDLIRGSSWEVLEQVEVGPAFSRDLVVNAIFAIITSSLLILIYLGIRFRFAYAVGAIASIAHDALLVIGTFSLFQFEINVPFVAAILTILGYSVNDTIINFDRIRENLKLYPRMDLIPLVNKSIVQVFSRTINTIGTTLVTVIAVLLLGGSTLKTFMLALAIGFLSGTYSSWFVAAPIVVLFDMMARRAEAAQRIGGTGVRKPAVQPVAGGAPAGVAMPAPELNRTPASPSESINTGRRKKTDKKKKPRRR
ncbi:MAG: protein translocase subunit SecF [bacterium JZ-2024 1]